MNLLKINIPEHKINLKPDNSNELYANEKCEFKVELINLSNEFASFEIELYPKDSTIKPDGKWYSVEPEICSKIQPGDCTDFYIRILKAPIHAYNRTIELEIKAFSIEYQYLSTIKIITLDIKYPDDYFKIELPIKNITSYPGEKLDIPWIIYNFSQKPKDVALTIELTNPFQGGTNYSAWINSGENFRVVSVAGGQNKKDNFQIDISSDTSNAIEGLYTFYIQAQYDGQNYCSDEGELKILPYGTVEFECPKKVQSIPSKKLGRDIAQYELIFTNESNVKQTIVPVLEAGNQEIEWCNQSEVIKSLEEVPLKEPLSTSIKVRRKRHIFGKERKFVLQVIADVLYANSGQASEKIQTKPNSQVLQLKVKPIIPFGLQIALLLLGLVGLLLYSLLRQNKLEEIKVDGHINSVRFIKNNNNENIVVSGSSNQTISLWNTNHPEQRLIFRQGKPIRVIRERPGYNNQIVIALDTGKLEIWQVQPTSEPLGKPFANAGRAFALDFSDKNTLFSGHAGMVYQWNLSSEVPKAGRQLELDFAVFAISVINKTKEQQLLAVVGQYNQLLLWDWKNKKVYEINYYYDKKMLGVFKNQQVFGKNDYINSTFVTENKRYLATADNQGVITLWNIDAITKCIGSTKCTLKNNSNRNQEKNKNEEIKFYKIKSNENFMKKQWVGGDNNQSVRSIAMTNDAKHLISVGEDGRVKHWCNFNTDSILRPSEAESKKSDNSQTRLRSVDIKELEDNKILIATDAPNNQVKIHQVNKNDCQ